MNKQDLPEDFSEEYLSDPSNASRSVVVKVLKASPKSIVAFSLPDFTYIGSANEYDDMVDKIKAYYDKFDENFVIEIRKAF